MLTANSEEGKKIEAQIKENLPSEMQEIPLTEILKAIPEEEMEK